jgi:hypothetical protein
MNPCTKPSGFHEILHEQLDISGSGDKMSGGF